MNRHEPIFCELCGNEINARTWVMHKGLCIICKEKVKGLQKCGYCERWDKFYSCEFSGSTCKDCFEKYGNADDEIPQETYIIRRRKATSWKKDLKIPYPENELIIRKE